MDRLGEISKCRDWLALTLSAQHGEFSEKETQLLEGAVEAALGSEERSYALRNLSLHHFFEGRSQPALETLASLASDPEADEGLKRSSKVLHWRTTKSEDEFHEALAIMYEGADPGEILQHMVWLMETEHISEALELAKPLVEAGNPIATLFGTECHLRQSNASSASGLFNKIDSSIITTSQLLDAYAHVQGLLVLKGHREDLRLKAIRDLENRLHEKSEASEPIKALLQALQVRDSGAAPDA